jgi:hypothetical protein
MTDSDIMILSLFFNTILLFNNWLMHKRYEALGELFGKTVVLVGAIADGKAMPKRDSEGNIRIKEIKNETN